MRGWIIAWVLVESRPFLVTWARIQRIYWGEFTDNVERTLGMLSGPTLTWRPKPVSPQDKPTCHTGMDQA